MKCQAIITDRDTQDQQECGKPATHTAYEPPIHFCDDCLHSCMEDASPEEQSTVRKISMIQLKIIGVSRRTSSEVGTRRFTYPEDRTQPRVVQQFHGAEWEEVEFQLLEEKEPTVSVANIEGSGYLIGNSARILLNDPQLFGTFKVGDIVDFVPNPREVQTTGEEVITTPAPPITEPPPSVVETTVEPIVVPSIT